MNYPLAGSASDSADMLSWHDRVQIALAIADADLLRSLLINCAPPIAQLHRLGGIRSTIGVPMSSGAVADGVIDFEEVTCVLSDSSQQLEERVAEYTCRKGNQRGYIDLTRCEAETQTLGQPMSLSQAISLLAQVGFVRHHIERILNLPSEAWHKSWWYYADESGAFTIPFLRLLRSRRFIDGKFVLQYKDFFAQEQPSCFKSCNQQVLVEILPEAHQFQATLAKINLARQQAGIDRALLICNRLSDIEAQGFISQGISLYAAHEIASPVKADCCACGTPDCPMRGKPNSPVLVCQRFRLAGNAESAASQHL